MSVSQLVHAEDRDFDQVVLSDPSPVLVEFFSSWCAHCGRMAPLLAELARDYDGRLRVVQVDAETGAATVARYQVEGVPTMIVFAGGREVRRFVGEMSKEALEGEVERALARLAQQGRS